MNFRKLTSIDMNGNLPSEFTKSIRRKRDYFDPNNILRKAVLMNGKKSSKNLPQSAQNRHFGVKHSKTINPNQANQAFFAI